MSIFPTKVLLATDGSAEARLAASTAADLANRTDTELHVVHVAESRPPFWPRPKRNPPNSYARLGGASTKR